MNDIKVVLLNKQVINEQPIHSYLDLPSHCFEKIKEHITVTTSTADGNMIQRN